MLDHLAEEGDDALRAVAIHLGEVDLVAEHDEPLAELDGGEDEAVGSASVLAVVVEGLHEQLRSGGGGEVEAADFHVGKGAEGGEESHGLAGAGRSAEDERLVLGEPSVEEMLVSDGVESGYDDVGRSDLVSLHFDLVHLGGPGAHSPLRVTSKSIMGTLS